MAFRMECTPAFDFARARHETEVGNGGAHFRSHGLTLGLGSDVPVKSDGRGVVADFSLDEGEEACFVLGERTSSFRVDALRYLKWCAIGGGAVILALCVYMIPTGSMRCCRSAAFRLATAPSAAR